MKKKQGQFFWGGMDRRVSGRLRNLGAEGLTELEERVLDAEVVEFLAVLEIFGVEDAAIGFVGGGDD